jgi:hypothetical protein
MKNKNLFAVIFFFCSVLQLIGQTRKDTINCFVTTDIITIDGRANESAWDKAVWYNIENVWIPYGQVMDTNDFRGRYKTIWDNNFFYILAEIRDDSLSDDHTNPLESWWDDDCLEIFIDEDYSGGNHEKNNNAFAYHVSLTYDAIDLNSSGSPVNYKDNLKVRMDTIGEHLYLWEIALKLYDKNFSLSNPEASRVYLSPNNVMGFTLAYCDNDQTTSRENFIGSIYMTQSTANNNYITADYFGTIFLVDPDYTPPASIIANAQTTNVSENGGSSTISISLSAEPDSIVPLILTCSDTTEATLSSKHLVFDSLNWNIPQQFQVIGTDDTVVDGNVSFTISIAVDEGSDNAYAILPEYVIDFINIDNDFNSIVKNVYFNDAVVLYPNPFGDFVTIDIPDAEDFSFAVFDLTGKQLINGSSVKTSSTVDLSMVQPGNYLLEIISNSSIYMKQILKK